MIMFVLFLLTSLNLAQSECPNPGLSFCNLNLYLEDHTGPVCDIVAFEGCEEKFSHLTAESWADLYTTFECYCEQPEIQQFLKTAALPAVIVFDQISNEYQHDYSVATRRNLQWGWEDWLGLSLSTTLTTISIILGAAALGRRELATIQPVTFDFNEVFHTCNAIDVPTSFCSQFMSENAFEFSQVCGGDLSCEHDFESVMEILESAKSTTLAQVEPHTECPDLGLSFCLIHTILDGKFGPVCDNLLDGMVIDNCESQFAGLNAEDFIAMYELSNMDCFCSREEVQMELAKARPDVIIFDSIMVTSHVALPSRRALSWGWEDWFNFGLSTTLGVVGVVLGAAALGRRSMEAAVVAHFDWVNIVEVCSQYTGFDMCEMPAELNVKQFEFLCLGKAECEVSVKDLNKLLKYNYGKQVTARRNLSIERLLAHEDTLFQGHEEDF